MFAGAGVFTIWTPIIFEATTPWLAPKRPGLSTNERANFRPRMHRKQRPRIAPRPFVYDLLVSSSVAVDANSHAYARSAEADTTAVVITPIVITPALDITLTRSVSI